MYKVVSVLALCAVSAAAAPDAKRVMAMQPLRFEPNRGQNATGALFMARGAQGSLLLNAREAVVPLPGRDVRLQMVGGATHPVVKGENALPSFTDYRMGSDRSRWQRNVAHFGAVRYEQIYPGVDLVFHGRQQQLEYDFEVAPRVDPRQIRVRFEGADRIRVAPSGELLIDAGKAWLTQPVPVAYQDLASGRKTVRARYKLVGRDEVAFELGRYDRSAALTIDPVLSATYFGGSNTDVATAVAYDTTGGLWITGYTASDDLPVLGVGYAESKNPVTDVFAAHYSPAMTLDYVTYFGGDNDDRATAIAVDNAGNAYITGYTASTNFPLGGGSYQASNAGLRDLFIAQLNNLSFGSDSLWYSTYIGGTGNDVGAAIAVAPNGTVVIAGYTSSEDFPMLGNGVQTSNRGGFEAIVMQVDTTLATESVRYTSYFGGASTDVANGVVVTPGNQVYLSGYTMSADFPTAGNAPQLEYGGGGDAFLVRFDLNKPGLDALDFGTYLGGTDTDLSYGLRRDSTGRLYLVGYTMSTDFPVTESAFQRDKNGEADLFLTRFDVASNGSVGINYSTFLGGNATDIGYGLAVDNAGRVAISGYTYSTNFPLAGNSHQPALGGGYDAFVSVLNVNQSGAAGLIYSTYFGGPATEVGYGVAFDNRGNLALAGVTTSLDGIVAGTSPAQQNLAGYSDAFAARYNLCDIPGICAQ